MNKFFNISETCKKIGLVDYTTNKPLNHILRYWEKQFPQIKPKIINNRRYYSIKDIEIVKKIKFFLKDQKMTIDGTKKLLNLKLKELDDFKGVGYRNIYFKENLKIRSKKLLSKLKKIKIYGKKNSS